jgi:cytoskeletal protein CcmA (bactofilin family)
MFNRSTTTATRNGFDRQTRNEIETIDVVTRPPPAPRPVAAATYDTTIETSVIGRDLTIMGEKITILSKGALEIDAEIQGNLGSVELVVGENARIDGIVAAETVIVRGQVVGAVRGQQVTLQSGARVEGDITYTSLSIEQGAVFDGRSRHSRERAELTLEAPVKAVELPPAGQMPGAQKG